MKIAVTGGNGFVGSSIVSELLGRGHEVRILARSFPEDSRDGQRHFFHGNVVTGEGLDGCLEGADAVIHLVGIIEEKKGKGVTFDAVHRRGTLNVVEGAVARNVPRYIQMSALGTRGDAVSAYHRTKWAAEEAVRKSGLIWTIFRPSVIFGPGDAFINMLADIMRKTPVMPVVGGGKNLMQPVAVKDVAASFRVAVESPDLGSRTYELGGPEIFTFDQIVRIIAKVTNKKRIFVPVPFQVIRPPVTILQSLRIPLPVTTDQLTMLAEDNIRKGGDPIEELGIDWTPFEEGIREYLGEKAE